MNINGRVLALVATMAALPLAGCVSSPTYGTDKSANAQLLDDMTNIVSMGPKRPAVEYKPRPELVRPGKGQAASLPAPQDKITGSSTAWPESPEQRRARLRAEATANQGNPNYVSPIASDAPLARSSSHYMSGTSRREEAPTLVPSTKNNRAEVQRLQQERRNQTIGTADTRRYLSEPPITYRQPAATADTGDLGEDESVKERRRKAEARGSKSWTDSLPWN